jgi:hypothetical protein
VSYDTEAAERVRRTLRAVAEATPVADDFDWQREVALVEDGPTVRDRRRMWLGAGSVAAAAAVLVAVLMVVGDGLPAPVDPAGPGEVAGSGADTFAGEDAGGGREAAAVTDVAVPGAVPEGFEFDDFRVLDPLAGAVEVDLYADGDKLVGAVVTDEPETAHRLAERLEAWSTDPAMVPPRTEGGDGFMAFGRDAGLRETEDVIGHLVEGVAAEAAVPDGYELAVSVTTRELPEAGRLVAVEYSRGDGVLAVETRQGTLSPELAPVLYPDAEPRDVRGRDGFEAATADGAGTRLIWQEAPGLVVSVAATAVIDRPVLDSFVNRLTVVGEESWVALRRAVNTNVEPPGPVAGMPIRLLAEGQDGGRTYRMEAFDGGSLERGVTGCHRLALDGVDVQVACAPIPPVAFAAGDTAVVWMVAPGSVRVVEADVAARHGPVRAADPSRPDGPQQVLVVLPAGGTARLALRDADGAVIDQPMVALD